MSESAAEQDVLQQQVSAAGNLPRHIAFIMDGNGRWAKSRNLPRVYGHHEGVSSVREMVETGVELELDAMTFYTFSTENWKRPAIEVNSLMKLLVTTIRKEVDDLDKNNVHLNTIGHIEDLPEIPRRELEIAKERLQNNDGMILNLALSYSGRSEIVRAVNRLLEKGYTSISEEDIASELDTQGIPDPDLIIRTSGELRLSNFLLWQAAYTELYATPIFWPDFRRKELLLAIQDYQRRERRYGRISEQLVQP
ncbi:isoprenyl transferase [bacterium]|nr:isoprenyl transferase [bacterium]